MSDEIAYDDSCMEELKHRANHWHDTAQMLKRQRDLAEEEREGWKLRAMQSEQQRQSLRDQLVIAEGQRDQAKADAEHWKAEWAVVMGQLGGARAEVEALRKAEASLVVAWASMETMQSVIDARTAERDALRDIILWALGENGEFPKIPWGVLHTPYPFYWWRKEMRSRLDAALAVQPTTGEGDE